MAAGNPVGMRNDSPVAIRDRASRRVRRLSAAAIAGATALTGAFAGLAAGSTHTAKTVAKKTAHTQRSVTAPEPTLIPNGSTATPTPSTPVTPAPTVTQSSQPPVAVTGGS